MARPNTRSPTPAGSYSSRRRRGRDFDRYTGDREDRRGDRYRQRSRSRSPDRRYHGDWRRNRSRERRHNRGADDRSYRPRDDPSRDRKRSRERSPVRDGRDRDNRRRDDSRDRVKKRREDSTDSRRNARRDVSPVRHRDAAKSSDAPAQTSPDPKQSEEAKKAEQQAARRANAQAYLAQLEAKRKEQEQLAKGGARDLLDAMDKKSSASPTVASPQSPAVNTGEASPKPFTGKFDPKAIAKKVTSASSGVNALGGDIAIPTTATSTTTSTATSIATPTGISTGGLQASQTRLGGRLSGNVSGFGFGSKSSADAQKPGNKRALDLEDEESTRKKLERLPTPPLDVTGNNDDDAATNDVDQGDDDVDIVDGGTEEEAAAAARAAAEKREERLQTEDNVGAGDGDVQMAEAPQTDDKNADEEEVDPLDAFMSGLSTLEAPKKAPKITTKAPVAMYGDDDDLRPVAMDSTPEEVLAMTQRKRTKGAIGEVDHTKMSYPDVRFDFYTEPSELAEMSEEDINNLRFELDGIKVMGQNVPKPVSVFAQCGLGINALDVLRKLQYEKPTPIQAQAIPAIMSGRDIVGVARTGSGKTLAFLLPMFRHILDQDPLKALDGPIGLVLAPTRELAAQIYREAKPFTKALNIRAVVCGGGAPIKEQIAELKKGAQIVVCTPGRLIELLAANSGRVTNLARVTYLVLDEADRMFDMGFTPQIKRIMANIRPKRQTVLFSATFPPKLQAEAEKSLQNPVEIIIGGRAKVPPEVTQVIEIMDEASKFNRLLGILGEIYDTDEDARTLVFVERQQVADKLLDRLMKKMYPCNCIHGAKDQVDRDSALSDFKSGACPILIATSVAARGLDVKQLKLVINFDVPNHLEDYVHRAGRTGRAGQKGTAITFITPDQSTNAGEVVKALKHSEVDIPQELLELASKGKRTNQKRGFMGSGLDQYDLRHEQARKAMKKKFKTGEEEEEEEEEEAEIAVTAKVAVDTPATPARISGIPKGVDLDGPIQVFKTEQPATTSKSNDPLEKVRAAANKIDGRLTQRNQLRPGQPIDNKGPDAGAFHATLEINDFPQKARWAVTNRTNVAKILEATGTSITTKGNFYPAGKEPGADDMPKLYILVEGDTEIVVTTAMKELMRLLKEGTLAAEVQESRAPTGKYSVV